jgi:hypothetical protein
MLFNVRAGPGDHNDLMRERSEVARRWRLPACALFDPPGSKRDQTATRAICGLLSLILVPGEGDDPSRSRLREHGTRVLPTLARPARRYGHAEVPQRANSRSDLGERRTSVCRRVTSSTSPHARHGEEGGQQNSGHFTRDVRRRRESAFRSDSSDPDHRRGRAVGFAGVLQQPSGHPMGGHHRHAPQGHARPESTSHDFPLPPVYVAIASRIEYSRVTAFLNLLPDSCLREACLASAFIKTPARRVVTMRESNLRNCPPRVLHGVRSRSPNARIARSCDEQCA